MMKPFRFFFLLMGFVFFIGMAGFFGCDSSGSSKKSSEPPVSNAPAVLDEEYVDDAMERVVQKIPACQVVDKSMAAFSVLDNQGAKTRHSILAYLNAKLSGLKNDPSGPRMYLSVLIDDDDDYDFFDFFEFGTPMPGDCGGTVTINSSNDDLFGAGPFSVVFDEFCTLDYDTFSSPVEATVDGKIVIDAVWRGSNASDITDLSKLVVATDGNFLSQAGDETASFNGKIVIDIIWRDAGPDPDDLDFSFSVAMNGEGQFTSQQGRETTSFSIRNLLFNEGSTARSMKMFVGDDDWIDQEGQFGLDGSLSIGRLSVLYEYEGESEELRIENLNATIEESGGNQVVRIASGRLYTSDGYVEMYTVQPLVFDEDGNPISGSVNFSGADGTVLTVFTPSETGEFDIRLDGEEIDQSLYCPTG